jgi:hypothetical protein
MKRTILVALAAAALALVQLTAPGGATPSAFQLVFVGHNVVASYQPSPTGVAHVGTFTTNSPLCPSGIGQDIAETQEGVATRLFTCDGSAATFTTTISLHIGELGGSGSWWIVSGTGPLADLRGQGSFSSVLTSGDPSDIPGNLLALAFRSTWTGTVDLDATPPSLSLTKAAAARLARPKGTYRLSVALALSDSGGGAVSYNLTLIDPATLETLGRKNGTTSASSIAWTSTIKPSAGTRTLRLQAQASDPVGNQTQLKHVITLRK